MARIGHIETLQPDVPTFDTWVDLQAGSSSNYGEHGDTGGEHTATGVWAYQRTTVGSVDTRCILRDAATGAYIAHSGNVVVNSATGAWYYYPLSGTFTQTNVAWFIYADASAQLGIAKRTTAVSGDIKKHNYNSNMLYDTPTLGLGGWGNNIHNLFSYYEYDLVNTNSPATGAPAITGTTTVGETLSVNVGGISDPDGVASYAYQWNRNGSAISGQTGATYLLITADIGTQITVSVVVTDNTGNVEAPLVSAPTTTILAAGITTSETVGPKSGYDYVELTSVSTNAAQTTPALQVGYQIYGDTLGGTITLNADGTMSDSAVVEVHDSTVWIFPQFAQIVPDISTQLGSISSSSQLNDITPVVEPNIITQLGSISGTSQVHDITSVVEPDPEVVAPLGVISGSSQVNSIETIVEFEEVVANLGQISQPQTLHSILTSNAAIMITNTTPVRMGESFTITVSGADLTTYSNLSLVLSALDCGVASGITATTATFTAPSQGLKPGINHNLVLSLAA